MKWAFRLAALLVVIAILKGPKSRSGRRHHLPHHDYLGHRPRRDAEAVML